MPVLEDLVEPRAADLHLRGLQVVPGCDPPVRAPRLTIPARNDHQPLLPRPDILDPAVIQRVHVDLTGELPAVVQRIVKGHTGERDVIEQPARSRSR